MLTIFVILAVSIVVVGSLLILAAILRPPTSLTAETHEKPANRPSSALSRPVRLTLALRVSMELGIIAGLAFWGVHTGTSQLWSVLLGIAAPVLGFGFWGAVDFRRTGEFAEALRLAQELVVSFLAVLAVYVAGQHALGLALAGLSLGYHAAVYLTGGRLLTEKQQLQR